MAYHSSHAILKGAPLSGTAKVVFGRTVADLPPSLELCGILKDVTSEFCLES